MIVETTVCRRHSFPTNGSIKRVPTHATETVFNHTPGRCRLVAHYEQAALHGDVEIAEHIHP